MAINPTIRQFYHLFRRQQGETANVALRSARTLFEFERGAFCDSLRIRAEYERESYAYVFGEPVDATTQHHIDLYGCVCVFGEYSPDGGETWHRADSVGFCIYSDPLSPWENSYVVDIMRETIDALLNTLHSEPEGRLA